jgi:prevent-host-death family protein
MVPFGAFSLDILNPDAAPLAQALSGTLDAA